MPEYNRRATDRLERRLEFETLISDLSTRFINLPARELDNEIQEGLRRVCEFLGVDHAVLWQWSVASPEFILPTHVFPQQADGQRGDPIRQASYPWYRQQLLAGRVIAISSLDQLPPEAAVDRESGRALGIKSNLCLPLIVGGEPPVGALALNTMRAEREWPDALVKRLQLVAQIFTSALVRQRADQALRESEEIGRVTFEQAAVGIAHVGIDGRWLRVNDKLCAVVGYSREELLRLTFQQITHPDDLDADLGYVGRLLAGELNTFSIEKRYIRKDDSVVWINLTVSLVRTPSGKPGHFISVVEEITKRRRAEEALRVSETRLKEGAVLAGLAFYEVDFARGVAFADERFRELCGVPPEMNQGLKILEFWMEHLHPEDRQRVLELREQLHAGVMDPLTLEYRFMHPTSGLKWINHRASVAKRDATGRAVATFGILRDVTESKRAEETLRDLSRRLIRAHEEERALLARELHDDVTQRLAVLAIDVGRAEMAAQGGSQAEAMQLVRDGLVRLSEDIHTMAYQLHPSVLEELGLCEALRTDCERVGRRNGVALSVELDPVPAGFGKDQALCLFRIAQESLNNVTRHSAARRASIALRQMDGGLLLAVRDDGVGFDPAGPGKGKSLGLASMRERVLLVNGTLDIESAPGHGTAIIAWVPGEGGSR